MWTPLWLRIWLNSRKPPKPFVPGMTIEPGESAVFALENFLPDDVSAELQRLADSGADIQVVDQGAVQNGNIVTTNFAIIVNNRMYGEFQMRMNIK